MGFNSMNAGLNGGGAGGSGPVIAGADEGIIIDNDMIQWGAPVGSSLSTLTENREIESGLFGMRLIAGALAPDNSIAFSPVGMVGSGDQSLGAAYSMGVTDVNGQGLSMIVVDDMGRLRSQAGDHIDFFDVEGIGLVETANGYGMRVFDDGVDIGNNTALPPQGKLDVIGQIISLGTYWTTRTQPTMAGAGQGIAYGNGVWVMCTSSSTTSYSYDGVNWYLGSFGGLTPAVRDLCFGNGIFVAVTSSSAAKIVTSVDGRTWTLRQPPNPALYNLQSVCYGNGIFVAVSATPTANGRVVSSTDAITWTESMAATNNNWEGVTWGNGKFLAVASTGTGTRMMESTDGVTWTNIATAPDYSYRGIAYGNGVWVAVSVDNAPVVISTDNAATWTPITPPAFNYLVKVIWAEGLFIATCNTTGSSSNNRIMTSPNGTDWRLITTPYTTTIQAARIAYGEGMLVVVGTNTSGAPMTITSGSMRVNGKTNGSRNARQGGRAIYGGTYAGITPSKLAAVGGEIKGFITNAGNVGTGEDDLYSYTTEANMLSANEQTIAAVFAGSYENNANAKRIRAYFGGTVIFDSDAQTVTNLFSWSMKITIIRVSGTVVRCVTEFLAPGSTDKVFNNYLEVTGLTLANTNILKITGEATADNDIVAGMGSVKWFPASI